MSQGDIRRGQAVFNSTKAACTACHRVGYLGGNSGPDLTRIGGIRVERDLLESIVYPSLSFVRSYEPVVVVLMDGRVTNGLIRDETSHEITLVTGPNQESRIQRADIEEIRPSTVSVMPAGLDKQLTVQELADLVAFLKNAK
jgi:putative heme-binding domain-containing protein